MSNPAQDEFDALAASQRHRLSHHHADASDDSDANSDADPSTSYPRAKPSLRSNGHDTAAGDEDPNEDDDDDDWDQRYGGGSGLGRKTAPAYTIPKGDIGRYGNTGPKGVIADARAAEREMFERKRAMIAASRAKRSQNHEPEDTGRKWHEDDDVNDEDLEEEDGADEEFMEQWRQKRMGELETANANGTIGASAYGRRRGHGRVEVVDALGYLDAIEESPRGVVVVVFISDDEVRIRHKTALACTFFDGCWSESSN